MVMDRSLKQAIFLTIIIVSSIILVASLWNIDWVMWHRSSHWYYPFPGYWDRPVAKQELGFYVNLQYYQVAISFILGVLSAYKLGENHEERTK